MYIYIYIYVYIYTVSEVSDGEGVWEVREKCRAEMNGRGMKRNNKKNKCYHLNNDRCFSSIELSPGSSGGLVTTYFNQTVIK